MRPIVRIRELAVEQRIQVGRRIEIVGPPGGPTNVPRFRFVSHVGEVDWHGGELLEFDDESDPCEVLFNYLRGCDERGEVRRIQDRLAAPRVTLREFSRHAKIRMLERLDVLVPETGQPRRKVLVRQSAAEASGPSGLNCPAIDGEVHRAPQPGVVSEQLAGRVQVVVVEDKPPLEEKARLVDTEPRDQSSFWAEVETRRRPAPIGHALVDAVNDGVKRRGLAVYDEAVDVMRPRSAIEAIAPEHDPAAAHVVFDVVRPRRVELRNSFGIGLQRGRYRAEPGSCQSRGKVRYRPPQLDRETIPTGDDPADSAVLDAVGPHDVLDQLGAVGLQLEQADDLTLEGVCLYPSTVAEAKGAPAAPQHECEPFPVGRDLWVADRNLGLEAESLRWGCRVRVGHEAGARRLDERCQLGRWESRIKVHAVCAPDGDAEGAAVPDRELAGRAQLSKRGHRQHA